MSVWTNAKIGLVLVVAAGAAADTARAGGPQAPAGAPDQLHQVQDDCGFYRSTAFGKGLTHFATEMLWACEAIQARRRAGMALSARLAHAEERFDAYRRAVVAASVADLDQARHERRIRLGIGEAEKHALAESTGALLALEAIRSGF